MLTMLNRLLHIIFFFALVASASAQNPYLQGSLSGTGAPGTKTRSPLNSMERAANSLAGATILTDTFGNQRLALFVHVEDTCINYTPDTTGNTANLSAFVEKCGTDSVWYIDWTGRSVFLGSSGGSVCDQDWLQISDNSCPDTIVDSIYHYKYAAIGARLVWPTAEFLVSDSVGVGIQVISGSRNARLVFYDNNNVKYSTIDQSGASTIWYMQPTGSEWRIATAAGGTPENPSGPFVNQFAVNPPDAPLPTVQAHQYPNTRMDTNTIRNFIYTDGVGKFRSQAIDTLIQIVVDSIAGDTALQNNWYVRDGTTTDLIRTATLDSAAQWLTDDGWIYFQAGALAGGRAYIDADESSIFFGDLGGVNTVEVNTTGIDITTSATASRAVDLTTDTLNIFGSFDPTNFRGNFLSDNSYLYADSTKAVGIGQFPIFPNYNYDGISKGFLYDVSDDGISILNGNGSTGGYNESSFQPDQSTFSISSDAAFSAYSEFNINANPSRIKFSTFNDASQYADIIMELLSSDPLGQNLFGVQQQSEDSVHASLYFGESVGGDYYSGPRAFGVRTTSETSFDWIQTYLPNDTTGNQVSFYNHAYFWKNEHPTGASGDTLFHFWAATGAGGEAGDDPGFMTLDNIRGPNFGENIYNTDDLLKNGGTTVGLDSGSLKFNLATTVANPYGLELTGSNSTTTNRFVSFKTEADSLRFQEFSGEYYMITNVDFQNNISDQYRTLADSVQWIEGTVQTDNTVRYVLGMTSTGWMKRFDGNAATSGQAIISNGTDWTVADISDFSLINWTESFSSATQATSAFTATNAATDINAAIIPKGTGAFVLNMPDGGTGGGNSRGANAVDMQTSRDAATQVASGDRSFIGGGRRNTASGAGSATLGGADNIASGQGAVVIGGYTTFSVGGGNVASGSNGGVWGLQDTATAANSYAIGAQCVASADYSLATNAVSRAYLEGQRANGAATFDADLPGTAQSSYLIMNRQITGTAQTELFLDGSTVQAILLGTNRGWNFKVDVVGICKTAGNGVGITAGDTWTSWHVGGIKRLNTTTSLVGTVQTPSTAQADAGMSTTTVTIDADDSTEALRIRITPPTTAGTTTVTRWVATISLTEVAY